MPATLDLALDLIRRPSVTPEDAGCQELLIARLEVLGFRVERLRFGAVDNFWARHGDSEPLFAFAGHTDVVPSGPLDQWQSPPFAPEIRDGFLYGRGAADMKGSLAAMIAACERFLAAHPHPRGSIAFLITSDEEGMAIDGTVKVVERLEARGEKMRWCLVGEPSCLTELGDTDQERPARLAQRPAGPAWDSGPRRLSASGAKSHPRHRSDPDHPCRRSLGSGPRILPADLVPDLQPPLRDWGG